MTPRAAGAALLAYAAFVVYGSLVPLQPQPLALADALAQFAAIPFLSLGAENRADWIANGVLYLPLGLLAAQWLRRHTGSALAAGGAWTGCALLALAVEFAQQWFPPRTVSQNDLLAEGIGAALGVGLAPLAAQQGRRLLAALRQHRAELLPRLAEAYLVVLVGFSFFPYDLVLSADEWALKMQSGLAGWWWARERGSLALLLLKGCAEVLLAAPLGLWWGWRVRPRRVSPLAALLGGAALGALIEIGQLAILSGVSEGASVATRAIGVLLGVQLAPRLAAGGVAGLRGLLARHAVWLVWPYALLLLVAGGWLRSPLQGPAAAAAVWRELHWLPFYYHYFTTEAAALFSLASVTLMYAPIGLLAWARGWTPRSAALLAFAAAALVEASKLALAGMRPDPTNALIAAAAAALAGAAAAALQRQPAAPATAGATGAAAAAPSLAGPGATAEPTAGPRWPGFVLAGAALGWALTLPALALPVFVLLAAAAAAVAWRLVLAPALIIGTLPLLDLAPWTGRLWFDEWLLLVLVCAGVAAARLPPPAALPGRRRAWLAPALVTLALVVGAARALPPSAWRQAVERGLSDPMSPLAALWLLQGAALAWVMLALLRRIDAAQAARSVVGGFVAALAGTVAVVAWERAAFPGLFDFAADYRVTGPFSAMHRGGAYLECFLVVGAAFALAMLLRATQRWQRRAAAALLAATGYAVMVTYSRNGYIALALVLLLGVVLLLPRGSAGGRRGVLLRGAAALALVAAVALPIALGGFARERIERSAADLGVRWQHWQDTLALHDGSLGATLFGMGLARFPELHHWRSREPVRAASLRWRHDDGRGVLLLGPGAPTYVEQWIADAGRGPLTLHAQLRSAGSAPRLEVALCEKWMLTSAACTTAVAAAAAADGSWQPVQVRLDVPPRHPLRPLKFSLLAPAGGAALEVAALRLVAADGRELLANGDFERGGERWFWTTDVDPPWHIHSLPLALWFEFGWFGVLAFAAALLAAALAALRRRQRGQWLAPAALAALAGLLASGLVNTLVDVPRMVFLLLLLLALAASDAPSAERPGGRDAARS